MAVCAALAAATSVTFAQAPVPAAPVSGSSVTLPGTVPILVSSSTLEGPVPGTQAISLALTLPLRDPDGLNTLLHDLYDASSPTHGQFLTPSQFTGRFGPTQADYDAVTAWAQAHGLTVAGTHPNRTVLDVTASAANVEQAFGIHLLRYLSPTGQEFYAPDAAPTVNSSLAGKLAGVVGLDDADSPHPADAYPMSGTASTGGTGAGGYFSPSDIRTAYGLSGVQANGSGQALALCETDGYNPSDIRAYESYYHLPAVSLQNQFLDGVSGSYSYGDSATFEAEADIELVADLAPSLSSINVYETQPNARGVLDAYTKIAEDDTAQQVSTSIIIGEVNNTSYIHGEDVQFKQMMAQGQTVYAASGDNGPYTYQFTNGVPSELNSGYTVWDPASQPYVCAVGGTQLSINTNDQTYLPETTWNDGNYRNLYGQPYASGGGVSGVWPVPYWQSQPGVVTGASQGSYNYRNLPDVALNASDGSAYSVFYNGNWQPAAGTSFAAPLWAAFTALVNQNRANEHLSPLGLADPYLYQIARSGRYAADFHDIADGSTNLYYPAVADYDLATGWGSLNGANLLYDLSTISAPAAVPLPFYRLYNASLGGHFYTTDPTEENADTNGGYAYEALACYAYGTPAAAPGLTPFYHLYAPGDGDQFFTDDPNERARVLAGGFYQDAGVSCYVFPTGVAGTVPLYRAYYAQTGQHFYTASQAEYGGLGAGWTREGARAYVLPFSH